MFNITELNEIDMIYVIVNPDIGSKVLHTAKESGINGGTIMLGRGTIKSSLLEIFGITDERKEVVIMVARHENATTALENISREYKLEKPNHGIAFTTSVNSVLGTRCIKCDEIGNGEEIGGEKTMYHLITVIVDKGRAEEAIDAATAAGSRGGTIINARGSGIHETSKLFSMDIEPGREIVMILSENGSTKTIADSIRDALQLSEPGNGIIFVQDVKETYGLYQK